MLRWHPKAHGRDLLLTLTICGRDRHDGRASAKVATSAEEKREDVLDGVCSAALHVHWLRDGSA